MAGHGKVFDDAVTLNLKSRTGVTMEDPCESHGRKGRGNGGHEADGKLERKGVEHYVSLHHHSTYSYLDGFAMPEAHVRRAAEIGMKAMALTEHGNISSHVKFEQAADAADGAVQPIYGCEVYMGGTGELATQRKNHLTVLAMDQEGYKNLLRLVSAGWDNFYYGPTVGWRDLKKFNKGLVVLSGCTGSLLSTSLIGGKNIDKEDASIERARRVVTEFKRVFGDRYYLEVQGFPTLDEAKLLNPAMQQLSGELGVPLVATGDVHYTRPNEMEMQNILHSVRSGNKQSAEELAVMWSKDIVLAPPLSDRQMLKRLHGTGLSKRAALTALMNTEVIAGRCAGVRLPRLDPVRYPTPDSMALWREWILEGWHFRDIASRSNVDEYKDRLRHEMTTIEEKDFIDYFLIVSDVVKKAKGNGIPVGPARGSAAASLVCYLLRITEVDPLAFPNLLFERFIDKTRKDLPDIDLDFDDTRRHEIRTYLVGKYGEECVGNIGTFTTYKSKLAIDDVARSLNIDPSAVAPLKELLIERSSGDLRANATISDTVDQFEAAADVIRKFPKMRAALKLEGNVRGMGVHAAGLVVASGPLTDACALYSRTVNGRDIKVLSVDKYDAEHLNILKIDVLGLKTMGMISHCLNLINKPLSWLYEIPLDDPVTIKGFQANDVVGIFQFDGRAMRGVTAELKPDHFLEVCDITALARPGPLHNGAAAEYIDVKRGRKQPRQYHPLVEDIVSYTHGQIVYQEQILRIMGEIGGFDHVHRATVRKIISKKLGEQEFNRWWEDFWAGAEERGVSEDEAKAIWNSCITAGSYAFNVAHATSYGMLAWWTMYLKQHHPLEFFAASLTAYDSKKQLELLRDAARHGYKALPPDPVHSDDDWVPHHGHLLAGFNQVNGLGPKTTDKILEHRKLEPIKRWEDLLVIKGIGPKTVQNLYAFCAQEDPFEIYKLSRRIAEVVKAIKGSRWGVRRTDWVPLPTHTADQVPYSRGSKDIPVVWAGVITRRNLKELFELHYSRTGEELDPATVRDPELNEWVTMWGDDGSTDALAISINRWNYPRMRETVWGFNLEDDIVVMKGVKKGVQSRRAIHVDEMWVFSEHEEEPDADAAE